MRLISALYFVLTFPLPIVSIPAPTTVIQHSPESTPEVSLHWDTCLSSLGLSLLTLVDLDLESSPHTIVVLDLESSLLSREYSYFRP